MILFISSGPDLSVLQMETEKLIKPANSGRYATSTSVFRPNVGANIVIKHGFPCINVCQVPREMLKTYGLGFQHLPRYLANVNVLENNV